VGASILHQLGLDDLVATNDDEFVQSEFFVSIRAYLRTQRSKPTSAHTKLTGCTLTSIFVSNVYVCI
jgi:predicted O-linked N-acetylglucosamine transferase (SPINDLY family)